MLNSNTVQLAQASRSRWRTADCRSQTPNRDDRFSRSFFGPRTGRGLSRNTTPFSSTSLIFHWAQHRQVHGSRWRVTKRRRRYGWRGRERAPRARKMIAHRFNGGWPYKEKSSPSGTAQIDPPFAKLRRKSLPRAKPRGWGARRCPCPTAFSTLSIHFLSGPYAVVNSLSFPFNFATVSLASPIRC
jgi:hypothetical protein